MSSAALMFPPHTVRVGDAVTLHILQTERFKTARLSISAILPAREQPVSQSTAHQPAIG